MAKLLLVALALTAFLAVPMQAEAAIGGFCTFGICVSLEGGAPTGLVYVRACANVVIGCLDDGQPPYDRIVVVHGQPVGVPPAGICQTVTVPPGTGLPDGGTVVSACV